MGKGWEAIYLFEVTIPSKIDNSVVLGHGLINFSLPNTVIGLVEWWATKSAKTKKKSLILGSVNIEGDTSIKPGMIEYNRHFCLAEFLNTIVKTRVPRKTSVKTRVFSYRITEISSKFSAEKWIGSLQNNLSPMTYST